MKKEIAIVIAAIIMLSVLAVLPVISSDENATNVNKFYDANGAIISSAIIANQTGVSESELPIDIAATDDLIGKIAFDSDRDGDDEIYVMDADGTNVKPLTSNTAIDRSPAWSPDGSKIAFDSDRDGDREIHVMNSDGSNVVQLTKNSIVDLGPSWSPDGKKIAFRSGSSVRNTGIYVMNADGSNPKCLADPVALISNQAWSPDGSKIAFEEEIGDGREIYVMNSTDGSKKQRLIQPAYSRGYKMSDCLPAWSPAGDKIVFYSNRHGYHETTPGTYEAWVEIYIMDPEGSNIVRLTYDLDHPAFVPSWSPDGMRIAFASDRDGDFEIYVMNADGTNVKKLTSNTNDDVTPSWCCAVTQEALPTNITVSPTAVTQNVGETQQFTATAKDQYGNPMAGIDITWTSTNITVGTVSPASATTGSDGTATTTLTALAPGTTTVKAANGTVSGSASVTVQKKVEPQLMEGDVTRDSHVTMADAMFIAQYKVGLRTLNDSQLKCADTTDDGDVTMADAMHIAQWKVDPDGTLGVLFKPLWESPADAEMLKPVD